MSSSPSPLTPRDCDLTDFQYMELDVRRLRDSKFASTPNGDAFRAGLMLWCAAWHQIVKRWQELEAGLRPDLESDEGKLLLIQEMAAQQLVLVRENKAQQAALEAARPKVVYADAMLNAEGTVLVRDAAKTLGVPVRKLEKALREKGVILPDNAPAARYVAQGYFKEAVHSFDTNTRGRQMSRVARVTGRGLEFLRRFVERHAELFMPTQRARAAG